MPFGWVLVRELKFLQENPLALKNASPMPFGWVLVRECTLHCGGIERRDASNAFRLGALP